MAARRKASCAEAMGWLFAHGEKLGPLTGQDARALDAFAHLLELYCVADGAGQASALVALGACAMSMQPKVRPLARELIAWARDYSDADDMWPLIIGTGRLNSAVTRRAESDPPVERGEAD